MAEKANTPVAKNSASQTHTVVEHVGGIYTERILTKKDQDKLIGVDGVAEKDLVWTAGHGVKLDVTGVHEEVLQYMKSNEDFRVREVEVPTAS